MKRRPRKLIKLVVLLLLGAIVNVAVAWGCVLFMPVHAIGPYSGNTVGGISFIVQKTEQSAPIMGFVAVNREIGSYVVVLDRMKRVEFVKIECGIPMVALHSQFDWRHDFGDLIATPVPSKLSEGFAVSWKIAPPTILPTAPLWPGFAINTIFYAAMLWVVFFVPGMVRRRIRRRRGRCPACAYPIGTSPVCTECGKQLA